MADDAGAKNVKSSSPNKNFSSATRPAAPAGLSSGLQPGGTTPGGGPPTSTGSIGTGGGQTEGLDSGSKSAAAARRPRSARECGRVALSNDLGYRIRPIENRKLFEIVCSARRWSHRLPYLAPELP
jgi:hypothetical protein